MQNNIIAIIDSCSKTRQAYKSILSQQHALLFAETAQKGLHVISNDVRLIFLDVVLPDGSGFEVLSAIKQNHPSIPVVMTAFDSSEEKCLKAFRSGARDYVKKPLRRAEIIRKTEELMSMNTLAQGRRHIYLLPEAELNRNNQNIPERVFESITRVVDYIMVTHASPFDLDDACKMALLNRSYFCYYFKLVTGHTFKNYISHVKMQKAMELIGNQSLSITEIAQLLGFADISAFSHAFKKFTGMTPIHIKPTNSIKPKMIGNP